MKRQYLKYKDSGVEWFPSIPVQWQVIKLGKVGVFSASGIDKKSDANEFPVRMVNYTDVYGNTTLEIQSSVSLMETTTTTKKIEDHGLKKGDILFTPSSETAEDIGLSAVVTAELRNTVYSYHLIRLRTGERYNLNLGFKKYFCNVHEVLSQFSKACKGTTRQILGRDDFKDILILLPPVSEQKIIAEYLNGKATQVDDLIAKKERMIDLIKEERTAIINQAVTQGLDPKVEMKDSGIEWLDKVPKHWNIVPLTKYLESIADYRGKTPSKNEIGGVFLVTARNVKGGRIDYSLSQEFVDPNEYAMIMARGLPKVGDVLLTMEAPLGEVANVDKGEIALAQRIIKLRGKKSTVDNYFLKYWIMSASFQNHLQSLATGSTALGLKASKLNLLRIVLPKHEEQLRIVSFLDHKTSQIDAQVAREQKSIKLLKEFRTSLISEVVTGKIDVRSEVNA
jgi:type I restriction enzyme S subunit